MRGDVESSFLNRKSGERSVLFRMARQHKLSARSEKEKIRRLTRESGCSRTSSADRPTGKLPAGGGKKNVAHDLKEKREMNSNASREKGSPLWDKWCSLPARGAH